jgi:malonyl-CoA O-methyltransferase
MWQLSRYNERYAVSPDAVIPCVLIPGWSTQADIFEWLLPALAQHFVIDLAFIKNLAKAESLSALAEQLFTEIHRITDKPVWLVGWSLGGNIALEIANKHPEKVLGLTCIASNPVFVANEQWPDAMNAAQFAKFKQGISANSDKTLRRFDLLQAKGDDEEKLLAKSLQDYRLKLKSEQGTWSDQSLLQGLRFLEQAAQVELLKNIAVPCQFLLADNDQLVPISVKEKIAALNSSIEVLTLENAGHLPFLNHSAVFFQALIESAEKYWHRYEKKKIAQSFSKAAASYDESAKLQFDVAEQLASKVEKVSGSLLDLGCGTAAMAEPLSQLAASYIGADLAEGMLCYAKEKYRSTANKHWLATDMQQLALADQSQSAIFSSLAVQWSEDFKELLAECYRVLKPGATMYLATLGPNTLYELRQSFSELDAANHVNRFLSEQALTEASEQSGLKLESFVSEQRVLAYDSVKALMLDLKHIGAQQVLQANPQKKGLMGKQRFAALNTAYEKYRGKEVADNKLPATYEVFYLQLEKPV